MRFTHTNIPQFEELDAKIVNGQRWYTTPADVKYPSVTTILGAKEKPWLKDWRNMLGDKKADKEMKRCSDRGTAVHLLAEKYLNNETEFTKGEKPENIKLFNQLRFKLNSIDNIRVQEIPLYSDTLRVAGRVDCIGEYDGALSVIDFKTSNRIKTEDMILDYKLQCTMYSLCWYEMFGEFIEDFTILIAVENSMIPQVFKGKVKDYVVETKQRVDEFYNKQKATT